MAYGKKVQKEVDTSVESVEEVIQETESKPVKEVKQAPKKVQIDRDTMVECRNVTAGMLTYLNKNGYHLDWENYGTSEWMSVGELLTMKASQGRFLTEPWIIVDDEDVAEYLGLKSLYDKVLPVEDIESFLLSGEANISAVLATAPKGTKELIRDKAREMVSNGSLDSLKTIKMLEKELQTGFELFQE